MMKVHLITFLKLRSLESSSVRVIELNECMNDEGSFSNLSEMLRPLGSL
jgi:hypothetical protein